MSRRRGCPPRNRRTRLDGPERGRSADWRPPAFASRPLRTAPRDGNQWVALSRDSECQSETDIAGLVSPEPLPHLLEGRDGWHEAPAVGEVKREERA